LILVEKPMRVTRDDALRRKLVDVLKHAPEVGRELIRETKTGPSALFAARQSR
jgi:hypothetical protein